MMTMNHQLTRLNYLAPSPLHRTQKPFISFPGLLKTIRTSNYSVDIGPEQLVEDVRGREHEFTLRDQGFVFRQWPVVDDADVDEVMGINWKDEGHIVERYLPRVKDLLAREVDREFGTKGEDGERERVVKRCEVFDWRLRNTDSKEVLESVNDGRMMKIKPADIVHIDQSAAGALDRLNMLLPKEEVDDLLSRYRVQVFNVWRPLSPVVESFPLTVCDMRTVTAADIEEMEFITDEFVRLSYLAKWSDRYRFYYLSRMTNREVCIFQIFDSAHFETNDDDGQPRAKLGCPHTAFEIKDGVTPPTPRESVEVRLFVFSEL